MRPGNSRDHSRRALVGFFLATPPSVLRFAVANLNGEKPQKAWNYEQPAANFNLAWKSPTSARDTSGRMLFLCNFKLNCILSHSQTSSKTSIWSKAQKQNRLDLFGNIQEVQKTFDEFRNVVNNCFFAVLTFSTWSPGTICSIRRIISSHCALVTLIVLVLFLDRSSIYVYLGYTTFFLFFFLSWFLSCVFLVFVVAEESQADNRSDLKLDMCEPVIEAGSIVGQGEWWK